MLMNNRLMVICAMIIAAGAGWTWWWNQMADQVDTGIRAFLADQNHQGPHITLERYDISGFPFRLQVRAENMRVSNPGHDLAPTLLVPAFHAVLQPWDPSHILFFSDGPYQLDLGGDIRILTEETSHASLVLSDGKVDRFSAEIAGLKSKRGESLDNWQAHYRRGQETAGAEFYTRAQNLVLEDVNGRVDQLELDALIHPDLPASGRRDDIAAWRDQGGKVDIRKLRGHWQGIDVNTSGDLALDELFRLRGVLQTQIRGHEQLIDTLEEKQVIAWDQRVMARMALNILAKKDETGKKVLHIPANLEEGILALGPLKLFRLQPVL